LEVDDHTCVAFTIMTKKTTPFLDKLGSASRKTDFGLFFFDHYLSADEAREAFNILDTDFPWDLNPTLYGEKLKQHAFEYERYNKKKANSERKQFAGVECLERLCQQIERDFDGDVEDVFCNRFQDPSHFIGWHKDTYGRHIFVLSLGSSREVQFRHTKTQQIATVEPKAGDLYFFPLHINKTHQHRVSTAEEENAGTRLSFVFFFKPPKYAKQYKITFLQKLKGQFTFLTGFGDS